MIALSRCPRKMSRKCRTANQVHFVEIVRVCDMLRALKIDCGADTEPFPAFVEENVFLQWWEGLTHGLLDGLLGANVCVAGGAVLNCLLSKPLSWKIAGTKADIDVFIHGVTNSEAENIMKGLLAEITKRLKEKGVSYRWKCKSHTVTLVPDITESEDWNCSKCTFYHATKEKRFSIDPCRAKRSVALFKSLFIPLGVKSVIHPIPQPRR